MMMSSQLHQSTQRISGDHLNGQPEASQFEALLAGVDVVSFDLFDTLIQRDGLFSPKDLFYQVQALAVQQLGLRLGAFPAMRVHAEERARGIRACAILPGDIDTPLLDKRPAPPDAAARAKMMKPEDVAACVRFCIELPMHVVVEELLVRPR